MTSGLDYVKRATVALVLLKNSETGAPFTIVGSGFCIHSQGIVVTCCHVLSSFMKEPLEQTLSRTKKGEWDEPTRFEIETVTPYVLFFVPHSKEELMGILVRPTMAMARTTHDIGMLRLQPHTGFPRGFPFVEVAAYTDVKEGAEAGACGFPLGNYLQEQIGTVSSSFTKGIVSSIIPVAGVVLDYLKGFQLNLFATHGSSGGPVFLYDSGKIFGAVESEVIGRDGKPVQGLTKAAPIYPALENDSVNRMLSAQPGQPPMAAS
jgi:hypothetical protein